VGGRQILALWALEKRGKLFLCQSIGIDETNKFQLTLSETKFELHRKLHAKPQ